MSDIAAVLVVFAIIWTLGALVALLGVLVNTDVSPRISTMLFRTCIVLNLCAISFGILAGVTA